MTTNKQKLHALQIFQATLDKFKDAIRDMPDRDNQADLIISNWQELIDSDELIEKLSSITNFESLVGYQRQFSTKLSYIQILARESEKSAEIDLALHLLRECRGKPLTRLAETTDYKTPDFCETEGKELYEAKYIQRLTKNGIKSKVKEALTQIVEYTVANNLDNFGATVHIFTYDNSMHGMDLQNTVEAIRNEAKTTFNYPFNVNLQLYSRGIYGDASFSNLI